MIPTAVYEQNASSPNVQGLAHSALMQKYVQQPKLQFLMHHTPSINCTTNQKIHPFQAVQSSCLWRPCMTEGSLCFYSVVASLTNG
jgi:hypothetical protein